jgi:hypothetical protein
MKFRKTYLVVSLSVLISLIASAYLYTYYVTGPYEKPSRSFPVKRVFTGVYYEIDDGSYGGFRIKLSGVKFPDGCSKEHILMVKEYVEGLLEVSEVSLLFRKDEDKTFHVLPVQLFTKERVLLNALLVKNGWVVVTDNLPPNDRFYRKLSRLQQKAMKQRRGLWEQ